MCVRFEGNLRTFLYVFMSVAFVAKDYMGECASRHIFFYNIVLSPFYVHFVVLLSLFIVQVSTCYWAFRTIFL